ncbi:small GTP-binding protein [Histomonas meleagridis]|uniref:small GTP-binding protein n=1 Tax=Histomonas meleagridis TaxID=135588 RepID=UPI00355A6E86|nr:small GTP-binding protein [Histomonas meleagridis]KAH0799452.1 small GTP-binding protein [Histomonas meleagridis]
MKLGKIKLILVGDAGVGKSSIIRYALEQTYKEKYSPTVGCANFDLKVKTNDDSAITFSVWDTAGHEAYRTLMPIYYQNAALAFIVFDVTNQNSLNALEEFNELVDQKAENVIKILIGNKIDLVQNRVISFATGDRYAQEIGAIMYKETSALTGEGIMELFQEIVNSAEIIQSLEAHVRPDVIDIVGDDEADDGGGCC